MLHIAVALLSLAWPAQTPGGPQGPDKPAIEVTAPKDVANVRELTETLDALVEKVTACVDTGKARDACICSQPELLTRLRAGHARVLKDHPDWKDRPLSYRYEAKDGKPGSGVLVMPGIQRQLDVLECK